MKNSIILKNKRMLQIAASVAGALLLWQLAAMFIDRTVLLASPADVLIRLTTIWMEKGFGQTLLFSFIRIVGGFFCGAILGMLLGGIASRFGVFEMIFLPFMATIKSVPVASFVIIALIWMSSEHLPIFISFLMVLPIVYTNVLNAMKSMDSKMLEMADVFGLTFWEKLRFIYLPHIKPFLLSAFSVSLGLAWKSGVAAEVIGVPDGSLGERLYMAKIHLETVDLFAWTILIVLVSVLFEKTVLFLVKKAFVSLEN